MVTSLVSRTKAVGIWVFLMGSLPLAAYADKLNDDLQTVWESLWDERGTPRNLVRWDKPLTYTITGHEVDRHREHIQKAMRDAAQATQLSITEMVSPAEAGGAALLTFEIVKNDGLPDTMPCTTHPQWTNWALTKVVVKMQSKGAWRCTFHEVMHAMGILGHPSGKTVLSYFAFQRDEFLAMDQLLLQAWYNPKLKKGATPLEALVSLSDVVAKQPDLGVPPELVAERVRVFNMGAIEQVKALALGTGEFPTIVKRSGRASTQFMDAARPLTAYFVAQAYLLGTIVARDPAAASGWFKLSAQYGYSAGQVMWARALTKGEGVDVDLNAAHGWLSLAVKSNNSLARTHLSALEKTMTPEQLEAARLAPPPEVKVP